MFAEDSYAEELKWMKMICLEHEEQTESTPGRDLAEHPGQEIAVGKHSKRWRQGAV